MPFCTKCGTEQNSLSNFCTQCGVVYGQGLKNESVDIKQASPFVSVLAATGIVVGSQTWTEMSISGGGATGGYISSSGFMTMYSRPIESNSIEINRFFLRSPNGTERLVELKGASFAVREGHTISIIQGGILNSQSTAEYYYFNHSLGHELIDNNALFSLIHIVEPREGSSSGYIVVITILALMLWMGPLPFLGAFALWAVLSLAALIMVSDNNRKLNQKIQMHVGKLVQDARNIVRNP